MLIIISPAKTIDFVTPTITQQHSRPTFIKESEQLVKQLRQLSPSQISSLMKISDKLGHLNAIRFSEWQTPFTLNNAKQALLAFTGDVYTGLDAQLFSEQDFAFAQKHLRILSGLYGVLKPLDLIQAYRLEMSTHIEHSQGKNLYQFWGTKLTNEINHSIQASNSKYLINLASNEYFSALQTDVIKAKCIFPVFKDFKNGRYKIISFYAKKARGLMSAYIIKGKLQHVDDIKAFDSIGYQFCGAESDATNWVFKRSNI